jgi:Lrp/AsnC family leucine-responsive transcriptional regulator
VRPSARSPSGSPAQRSPRTLRLASTSAGADHHGRAEEQGPAITLSASSTADRLRRLVDGGVITGYTAVLAPEALGYPITAFVRLKYPLGNYKPLHDLLGITPEIVEAHHVTGDDCFILKLLARSMSDLERLAGKIAGLGSITTSVVYSSPLARRPLVSSS